MTTDHPMHHLPIYSTLECLSSNTLRQMLDELLFAHTDRETCDMLKWYLSHRTNWG